MVLACVSVCLLDKRLGLVRKRWLSKSGVEFLLESLPLFKNYGKAKAMAKGQACGRVSLTEYLIACQLIIGAVHLCTHFVFWEYG